MVVETQWCQPSMCARDDCKTEPHLPPPDNNHPTSRCVCAQRLTGGTRILYKWADERSGSRNESRWMMVCAADMRQWRVPLGKRSKHKRIGLICEAMMGMKVYAFHLYQQKKSSFQMLSLLLHQTLTRESSTGKAKQFQEQRELHNREHHARPV